MKATGTLSAQELEDAGGPSESERPREGEGQGDEGGGKERGAESVGAGKVGAEAWGWVEGVAQRAAGTFARRPPPSPGNEAEEGALKEGEMT